MGILINRRRIAKKDGLVVTTRLIYNSRRISGQSDGVPTYSSSSTYCVIEINLSKTINGDFSISQGDASSSSYTLFYDGETYMYMVSANPNPRNITFNQTYFNRILLSVRKANRNSAFVKWNDEYIWDGSKEDWSRWGL